jgi:hypothetical protein
LVIIRTSNCVLSNSNTAAAATAPRQSQPPSRQRRQLYLPRRRRLLQPDIYLHHLLEKLLLKKAKFLVARYTRQRGGMIVPFPSGLINFSPMGGLESKSTAFFHRKWLSYHLGKQNRQFYLFTSYNRHLVPSRELRKERASFRSQIQVFVLDYKILDFNLTNLAACVFDSTLLGIYRYLFQGFLNLSSCPNAGQTKANKAITKTKGPIIFSF